MLVGVHQRAQSFAAGKQANLTSTITAGGLPYARE